MCFNDIDICFIITTAVFKCHDQNLTASIVLKVYIIDYLLKLIIYPALVKYTNSFYKTII